MRKASLCLGLLVGLSLLTGCGQDHGLKVSGNIEAKEVTVSTEVGGVVKEMPAVEGKAVKAGEVLVRLDPTVLQYQLTQAKAALAVAEAHAKEVGNGSRTEQIRAAKANLDQVKALVSGAQMTINDLNDALTKTNNRLNEIKSNPAFGQNPSLQEQAANLQTTQNDLQVRLDNAKSQLAVYQAQQRSAQAQYDLTVAGSTAQAKEAAAAQVDQARAAEQLAEAEAAKAAIKSPVDGIVSTTVLQVGELASPGMALVKITIPTDLTITVYVPENRLALVKPGQEVKFTVDAFPGETFRGKVTKINSQAEFTPKNVQTSEERANVVFGVAIKITDHPERFMPGMSADVTF